VTCVRHVRAGAEVDERAAPVRCRRPSVRDFGLDYGPFKRVVFEQLEQLRLIANDISRDICSMKYSVSRDIPVQNIQSVGIF
jgi:hypothetical protein